MRFELVGQPEIIVVQKGDEFAARPLQAGIEGHGSALLVLNDDRYSWIVTGNGPRATIGRPVVDQDQLEFVPGLAKDRIDRRAKADPGVMDRHEHGDQRSIVGDEFG